MKKKLLVLLLSCVLILAFAASAMALTSATAEQMAAELKGWDLFKGVSDTDFALYRSGNRAEGIVMLVRALGAEEEALAGEWEHPFTDVPTWADAHVGYAYENGLTNGVSATTFGWNRVMDSNMYLTLMLRVLGYDDAAGDFTWNNPVKLANEVGLIIEELVDLDNFQRRDMVIITYSALGCELKDGSDYLGDKLGLDWDKRAAAVNADYAALAEYFDLDVLLVCAAVDGANIGLEMYDLPAKFDFTGIKAKIAAGDLDEYGTGEEGLMAYLEDELEVYMTPLLK